VRRRHAVLGEEVLLVRASGPPASTGTAGVEQAVVLVQRDLPRIQLDVDVRVFLVYIAKKLCYTTTTCFSVSV
jgi:hypothetical protein